jgi:Fic family protein
MHYIKEQTEDKIKTLGSKTGNAKVILDQLFQRPAINAKKIQQITGLSKPSVYKLINQMEKLKILKEITGSQRGKIYFFNEYLDLFY